MDDCCLVCICCYSLAELDIVEPIVGLAEFYVLRSLLLSCWLPGRTHTRKKRNERNKESGRIREHTYLLLCLKNPMLIFYSPFRNFLWQHVNNMKTNKHKQTDTMFPKYGFWLGIGLGWVIMRCHLPYEPLDHWPGATHPLVWAHHQLSSGSSAQHPRSAGHR